ncbi:hypothetical protein, partial [Litorimonas sp.]|uniref:hypothetical protein n=1 Tax=Litorimonas sp. TaxID=1892381 RepID=UPI003A84BB80
MVKPKASISIKWAPSNQQPADFGTKNHKKDIPAIILSDKWRKGCPEYCDPVWRGQHVWLVMEQGLFEFTQLPRNGLYGQQEESEQTDGRGVLEHQMETGAQGVQQEAGALGVLEEEHEQEMDWKLMLYTDRELYLHASLSREVVMDSTKGIVVLPKYNSARPESAVIASGGQVTTTRREEAPLQRILPRKWYGRLVQRPFRRILRVLELLHKVADMRRNKTAAEMVKCTGGMGQYRERALWQLVASSQEYFRSERVAGCNPVQVEGVWVTNLRLEYGKKLDPGFGIRNLPILSAKDPLAKTILHSAHIVYLGTVTSGYQTIHRGVQATIAASKSGELGVYINGARNLVIDMIDECVGCKGLKKKFFSPTLGAGRMMAGLGQAFGVWEYIS